MSTFDELRRAEFAALTDALPPQSLEAEELVIGGILLDPNAMPRVAPILNPSDFYDSTHRKLYEAAQKLHKDGQDTDLMHVTMWLSNKNKLDEVGGVAKLAQLVDRPVSTVNIDRYAMMLKEKSARRELIALAHDAASMGYDRLVDLGTIKKGLLEKLEEIPISPTESPIDRKARKFNRLLDDIKAIKLGPYPPALRDDLIWELAKATGRTVGHLEKIYYKSLLSDGDGPLMTVRELRDRVGDQSERWVLNGLFAAGRTTLLHAPGGTGKTKLLLDLCLSMVQGQDWGEFPITGKRKILVIQTDESETDLLMNLAMMGYPLDSPDLMVKTQFSVEYIPALVAQCQNWKPDLILIDSLTSISRYSCVSENDIEYARPLLELNDLAAHLGCHICVIHHSTKGEPGKSGGGARGSSALEAAVSQVIKLDRVGSALDDPGDRRRHLTITKSRSRRPAKYELVFDGESHRWTVLGEVKGGQPIALDSQQESIREKLLKLLRSRPGVRYCYTELTEQLGVNRNSLRATVGRLAGDGIVNKHYHDGMMFISLGEVGDRPPIHVIKGGSPHGSGMDRPMDRPIVGLPESSDNKGLNPIVADSDQGVDRVDRPMGDQPVAEENAIHARSMDRPDLETLENQYLQPDPLPDPLPDPSPIHGRSMGDPSPEAIAVGDHVSCRIVDLDEQWIVINATVANVNQWGYEITPWDSKAAGGHRLNILRTQILGRVTG